MSRVTSSLGRARNSSHVQRRGSSTSPTTEKSHWSSGVCGVGPAERTGKSGVTYWPGGTRSRGTSSRRRPLKPWEMIGGISPPYRWDNTPAAPGPGDARLCTPLARECASATSCLRICVGAGDPQARAVEHVDSLVFARVGVDRRLVAGTNAPLHDGPLAAGLLARNL